MGRQANLSRVGPGDTMFLSELPKALGRIPRCVVLLKVRVRDHCHCFFLRSHPPICNLRKGKLGSYLSL